MIINLLQKDKTQLGQSINPIAKKSEVPIYQTNILQKL